MDERAVAEAGDAARSRPGRDLVAVTCTGRHSTGIIGSALADRYGVAWRGHPLSDGRRVPPALGLRAQGSMMKVSRRGMPVAWGASISELRSGSGGAEAARRLFERQVRRGAVLAIVEPTRLVQAATALVEAHLDEWLPTTGRRLEQPEPVDVLYATSVLEEARGWIHEVVSGVEHHIVTYPVVLGDEEVDRIIDELAALLGLPHAEPSLSRGHGGWSPPDNWSDIERLVRRTRLATYLDA